MKKIIFALFCLIMLSSCSKTFKKYRSQFTYKDPETIGGSWTVTSCGITYNHLKCVYWGTKDDTAVFKDSEGKVYCFSGTMNAIQE